MGKRFYKLAGATVRLFSHRMKTEWETPFEEGPCVFVVNRAGNHGPVDMCAKFPLREKMHVWVNSEMLSAKEVPAYVRKSRWWKPESFFAPVLNATVPYTAAALMPPFMKSVPNIPVYRDQRIMLTLRQSVRALQKEEYLIVFPEQPSGWLSHHSWINTSWLRLGELWYRASGRSLKLYPVHLDYKGHVFKVSAPVWYDPSRKFADQEQELADKLAKGLRGE